jgi:glycosyltransferase involved in cell wall biosynthesis
MGWDPTPDLADNECYVAPRISSLYKMIDWEERIHIVPGIVGNRFLMTLTSVLSTNSSKWVHWSECVKPGVNRLLRRPLRKLYGSKIRKYALGALAISKMAEREFISWGVPSEKIFWLPYTLNPPQIQHDMETTFKLDRKDKIIFMFCGMLCKRKGTDLLILAFEKLCKKYKNCLLVLVGPDTKGNYYSRLVHSKALSEHIVFIDAVKAERIGSIISLCDVFILPSRYDGWGVVIFEAASIGMPIISTDRCGAAHHLILDGINGFRVESSSQEALFDAMQKYVLENNIIKLHGNASYEIAKLFYPECNVKRFLSAISVFEKYSQVKSQKS